MSFHQAAVYRGRESRHVGVMAGRSKGGGYRVSGQRLGCLSCHRTGIVLLVALVALAGCRDPNLAFIQGGWAYSLPGVGGIAEQSSV